MRIEWAKAGGLPECPFFRKWVLHFKSFSLRLHRWYGDDDHRAPHDHPYWFYTFVLRGGYQDVTYELVDSGEVNPLLLVKDIEIMRPGMLRYRPAEHLHIVREVLPNTWTFVISGKPIRRWGFQFGHKKITRDKYFAERGHHPCDQDSAAPEQKPVRLRPDGSRIE